MTGLGITATAAAFLNYRSAKRKYDDLVQKREALQAAVSVTAGYDDWLYGKMTDAELAADELQRVDNPVGVAVSTVLNVQFLGGWIITKDVYKAYVSLVLSNTGDKTVVLYNPEVACHVGEGVAVGEMPGEYELKPGQTLTIESKNNWAADPQPIREAIERVNGKVAYGVYEDVVKSEILYKWRFADEEQEYTAKYSQQPGVLRYY